MNPKHWDQIKRTAERSVVGPLMNWKVGAWNAWREVEFRIEPDLSGAPLSQAQLHWANLKHVDLTDADLSGAELCRADLSGANLTRANLSRADLTDADLSGADLTNANLNGAILSGTRLERANLNDARFGNAVGANECPLDGSASARPWTGNGDSGKRAFGIV